MVQLQQLWHYELFSSVSNFSSPPFPLFQRPRCIVFWKYFYVNQNYGIMVRKLRKFILNIHVKFIFEDKIMKSLLKLQRVCVSGWIGTLLSHCSHSHNLIVTLSVESVEHVVVHFRAFLFTYVFVETWTVRAIFGKFETKVWTTNKTSTCLIYRFWFR